MASIDLVPRFVRTLLVEAPLSGDDDPSFYTREAVTLRQLTAILRNPAAPPGTPQVDWRLRFDADRSAVGTAVITAVTATTNATTGQAVTVFNNGIIPADRFVWLELVTVTTVLDAPLSFALTVEGDAR